MKTTTIVRRFPRGSFEEAVLQACFLLSASENTRRAYLNDARHFLDWSRGLGLDSKNLEPIEVAAWVEQLRADGSAPKTRARRISALSSIYERLRKDGRVDRNPFSAESGPKREKVQPVKPTPIAAADAVIKTLEACARDPSFYARRDEAILRLLWATGARRSSIVEFTFERLSQETDPVQPWLPVYVAKVPAKGGTTVLLWIRGRAAAALTAWIDLLKRSKVSSGPIFRSRTGDQLGVMDIWRIVKGRGERAGVTLSPHGFRVAFLTLNPASIEERQQAVGHASPETTKLYDRNLLWRGKRAFEAMPEVEDLVRK